MTIHHRSSTELTDESEFSDMLDEQRTLSEYQDDGRGNFGESYHVDCSTLLDPPEFKRKDDECAAAKVGPVERAELLGKVLDQIVFGDSAGNAGVEPNAANSVQSLAEEAPVIFCPGFATVGFHDSPYDSDSD